MEPKWLYRLESTDPGKGLWYNAAGDYVWTIGTLPDCKTRDLPMGYDERYRRDGRSWNSSCTNPEDLAHWFSLEDALALMEQGFVFRKYLATEYTEYPLETVFIKETSLASEDVNPRTLYRQEASYVLDPA